MLMSALSGEMRAARNGRAASEAAAPVVSRIR